MSLLRLRSLWVFFAASAALVLTMSHAALAQEAPGIKVPAPPPSAAGTPATTTTPSPTLSITQTGDAQCAPGGVCQFAITVTNASAAAFANNLNLKDALADGSTVPIQSIDPSACVWGNLGTLPLACESAPVSLPPGGTWSTWLTIVLPTAASGPVTNCATVKPWNPLDTLGLFNATGPDGSVTACFTTQVRPLVEPNANAAHQPGLPLCPSGTTGVYPNCTPAVGSGIAPAENAPAIPGAGLLPPAEIGPVTISKTGDASCALGGTCNFTLTLFAPSDGDFSGQIRLEDSIRDARALAFDDYFPIVSVQPPLPCAPAPTELPFTCPTREVRMAAGQSQAFHITVQIPADYSQPTLKNCGVVVSQDDLSIELNGPGHLPRVSTRCVTVSITPPAGAQTQQLEVPTTAVPTAAAPVAPASEQPRTCFSNMQPDGNGGCQCPAGTSWNGKVCSAAHAVVQAPAKAPATAQPAKCPSGMIGTPPACSCPKGTRLSTSGTTCIAGTSVPMTSKSPLCPANASGRFPDCRCPNGTRYSAKLNACVGQSPAQVPLQISPGGIQFGGGGLNLGGFTMGFGNGNGGSGGTNYTQTQTQTRPQCPAGQHYSPGLRGCIPNATTTPPPAPAQTPAPDMPTDFGACPGCGAGGDEVIH